MSDLDNLSILFRVHLPSTFSQAEVIDRQVVCGRICEYQIYILSYFSQLFVLQFNNLIQLPLIVYNISSSFLLLVYME